MIMLYENSAMVSLVSFLSLNRSLKYFSYEDWNRTIPRLKSSRTTLFMVFMGLVSQ